MGVFDILPGFGGDGEAAEAEPSDASGDSGGETADSARPADLSPAEFRERADALTGRSDVPTLDFTVDSLDALDELAAGPPSAVDDQVAYGSYLGETIVRAYGGEWVDEDGWQVAVELPDDRTTIAVFDAAQMSIAKEPVFAKVAARLDAEGAERTPDAPADGPGSDEATGDEETASLDSSVEPGEDATVETHAESQDEALDAATDPADGTDETDAEADEEDGAVDDGDAEDGVPGDDGVAADEDESGENAGGDGPADDALETVESGTPDLTEADDAEIESVDDVADADDNVDSSPVQDSGRTDETGPAADVDAAGATGVGSDDAGETDNAEIVESDETDEAAAIDGDSGDGQTGDRGDVVPIYEEAGDPADAASGEDSGGTAIADDAGDAGDETDADDATDIGHSSVETPTAPVSDVTDSVASPVGGDDEERDSAVDADPDAGDDVEGPSPDRSSAGSSPADDSSITDDSSVTDSPGAYSPIDDSGGADSSDDESGADDVDAPTVEAPDPGAAAATGEGPSVEDESVATTDPADGDQADEGTDEEARHEVQTGDDAEAGDEAQTAVDAGTSDDVQVDDDGEAEDDPVAPERYVLRAAAEELADGWPEREFDFTPESLTRLDAFVDDQWDGRFRASSLADRAVDHEDNNDPLAQLGAYYAEVLIRWLDGEWVASESGEGAVAVPDVGEKVERVDVFDLARGCLIAPSTFAYRYDALVNRLHVDEPTVSDGRTDVFDDDRDSLTSGDVITQFAATAEEFVDEWDGYLLDYSPPSLRDLDDIVEGLARDADLSEVPLSDGTDPESLWLTARATAAGAYFAAILLRHQDAQWRIGDDVELVVDRPDGERTVDPVATAADCLRGEGSFVETYTSLDE